MSEIGVHTRYITCFVVAFLVYQALHEGSLLHYIYPNHDPYPKDSSQTINRLPSKEKDFYSYK